MKIPAYGGFSLYQYSSPDQAAAANLGRNNSAESPSIGQNQEFKKAEIYSAKKTGAIECTTCKQRKYQDRSNDTGVSFKSPWHISPEASSGVVRSHEQEHVRNEAAKAARENRKVVSQSVTLKTNVCPECGRVYVSGGETRTVTKSDSESQNKDYFIERYNRIMNKNFGTELDIKL